MPVSLRLRALRKAAGLTQVELARRSGIAQGDISKLEKGTAQVGFSTLRKLARALNVHARELIDDDLSDRD